MPTTTALGFEALLREQSMQGELVHFERFAPRPARHARPTTELDPQLWHRLGIDADSLWTHQADAVDAVRAGQSIVVATGTASGKSRCYQIPLAANALETRGQATSLLLFPTTALAQDQLRALGQLGIPGLVPVTYDGDTTPDARQWSRKHATAVLTNPDMLHTGILPYHGRWATFLKRLRLVVIDELHVYRGIFGTHLAQILRRLRRLCAHYGSDPVFVFASATIGEPAVLASDLCGVPVACIDTDGAPRGERLLAVWNPSPEDGIASSANAATASLLASLVEQGNRSIAFARSRRSAELIAANAKRRVGDENAHLIRPYRGGFLAEERREIEAQLFDGTLLGVAATSALELGVDIGGLDACLCTGFPGTIASFRQQIGRVGRGAQQSLAVLVMGDDALDQWYGQHPHELVRRPAEPVVVNVANPFVLYPHLACAAHEQPLRPDEGDAWAGTEVVSEALGTARLGTTGIAEAFDEGVIALVNRDQLVIVNGRAVYSGSGSPSARISLRSGGGGEYTIVDRHARLIGTVDGARAFAQVHEGALYLHQGQQYRVNRLDLSDRVAWVEPVNVDEYTSVRGSTDIRFVGVHEKTRIGDVSLQIGTVEVIEETVGYVRKKISTGATIGREDLALPPSTLVTRAFWYQIPDSVLERAQLGDAMAPRVPGTLHAAEHTMIAMLPLFTICDRWDVGGVSTAMHPQTGLATIAIYDGYPGGAGIAELGYAAARTHLRATLDALDRCSCTDGCPSCVQSPKCGNGNEPLDKHGAIALLRTIL